MVAAGRRRSRSRLPDGLNPTRRGGTRYRAAALLVILFATSAAGLPGLGPREARVAVDIGVMPWAAVARLQVPGVSRCTGFLVGPRTVATAAHCLYGRRLGHFAPPSSVHILLGYANGGFARHVVAETFRVAAGYDPLAAAGQGADVAVVTLTAPVAAPGAILVLADEPVRPGTRLMLGGYGQDRAERMLADLSCMGLGYAARPGGHALLLHDCAGTRGTSGSPVLAQGPDGSWQAVGMQVAGNVNDVGGSAVSAATIRRMLPGL